MDNQDLDRAEALLKEKLLKNATVGGLVKNWIKHPAFQLYKDTLQEIIADKKNTWLNGEEEKAKIARYEARGVQKALAVLNIFLADGEVAKKKLNELREDLGA